MSLEESHQAEGRVVKRRKNSDKNGLHAARPITSRIFAPYRTVGLVSPTSVPFTSIALGKTTFQITTSIGRSLQTYDLKRGLNLVFITRPQTPGQITATTAWKDFVLSAWAKPVNGHVSAGVWIYKRGKQVAELATPRPIDEEIQSLTVFGSWIVGSTRSRLHVWTTSTLEHYATLQTNPDVPFTATATTLPTLLNKVLVGKTDGSVEIWNVSSGRLVYTLHAPTTEHGAVTAIEPAPVVSLVAIGYEHGALSIHDVRMDTAIMHFNASETASAVTSIAFRTDDQGAGEDGTESGVMATACAGSGDITMWDLNKGGRKAGILRGAHETHTGRDIGGVGRIKFLPGQAIMVSSGPDNSLKTWIFDEAPFSAIPRPLHARSGHGGPVTSIDFLPSASDGSDMSGKWLLAGSQDRSLWGWSLRRDGQSTELSQGAVKKKAKKMGVLSALDNKDGIQSLKCPPVISIACCSNRDGGVGAIPGKQPIWLNANQRRAGSTDTETSSMTGWESVVTAHQGEDKARTWFWGRKRAGRWAFQTGDATNVSAVAISPCGTFALVGSEGGGIDMYNLQSGIHRQRYPPRLTPKQSQALKLANSKADTDTFLRGQGKHTAAVTGLAIDNLNRTIFSVDASSHLKFWSFKTGLLLKDIDLSAAGSITHLRYHRTSELLALSAADGSIRILDPTSYKIVRELRLTRSTSNPFWRARYVDLDFSADGRWLAACTGPYIAVWDLPTGQLVDCFKLAGDCAALAFSPTGEYLATAAGDSVGIDVWSNRTLYTHVPTRRMTEQDVLAVIGSGGSGPTASGEAGVQLINAAQDEEQEQDVMDLLETTDAGLSQLSEDLVSMSLVPRSRWQNLLYMDVIRARNKPTEAPKKPEKAPFFLPSLQSAQNQNSADQQKALTNGADGSQDLIALETERSRIARMDRQGGQSEFSRLLQNCRDEDADSSVFVNYLKSLSPAAADVEIRSLSSVDGEMLAFVRALLWVLQSKRDFELGQTWMAVFLRIHSDVVIRDSEIRAVVAEWREMLRTDKERISSLVGYCSGMVEYLRAGRV